MTGDYLTNLKWRKWGHERATGTGIYHLNLCRPSCAAGHTKVMPGAVTLTTIETCRGVRLYTEAFASFSTQGREQNANALGQPLNPCREATADGPRVRRLKVALAPTPRFPLPDYDTSGVYPQVGGVDLDLRAVNRALTAAVLADQRHAIEQRADVR